MNALLKALLKGIVGVVVAKVVEEIKKWLADEAAPSGPAAVDASVAHSELADFITSDDFKNAVEARVLEDA